MAYKVETIATDLELEFDRMVTNFINTHHVISMSYCTTVAPYNDILQPYFIVHIQYLEETKK